VSYRFSHFNDYKGKGITSISLQEIKSEGIVVLFIQKTCFDDKQEFSSAVAIT